MKRNLKIHGVFRLQSAYFIYVNIVMKRLNLPVNFICLLPSAYSLLLYNLAGIKKANTLIFVLLTTSSKNSNFSIGYSFMRT